MNIFFEPVNINQWNMFKMVESIGHVETFLATKAMNKGDMILLHVGSQNKNYKSGIYAIGEIIDDPFIYENHPEEYCNNKLSVSVRINKINFSHPYITHEDCKLFINQFRTVHKIEPIHYKQILSLI